MILSLIYSSGVVPLNILTAVILSRHLLHLEALSIYLFHCETVPLLSYGLLSPKCGVAYLDMYILKEHPVFCVDLLKA